MAKQILSEQFQRMQKLAGIINESEYKKLTENQASDLINSGITLYVSDDSKLAPRFIKPKKVGFIAIKNPSITNTLSNNPKTVQIFNDNYGTINLDYVKYFFTNANNWKAITDENELNDFMSKYSKIYLINSNGDSSQLKGDLSQPNESQFLDTEEGGYMREYIDEIVEEENENEPGSLDLEYRSDFDIAFNLALTKLKKDHPELDFRAIKANKESFF